MMSLENLNRFIQQAEHDPAVTNAFIQEYESLVRNELQVQSNRYAFASLYGKLVNEWISAGSGQEQDPTAATKPEFSERHGRSMCLPPRTPTRMQSRRT